MNLIITRAGLALAAAAVIVTGCASDVTAIRNVTVIPANGSGPITSATVTMANGEILAVGKQVPVAFGARIIDGSGKFLIPGLWDMHVHLSKTRPSAMKLFIANGVTSVRDMGGDIDELLRWRDEVASGERLGPTIYTAGTYLESPSNIARMLAKPVADNVEPVNRTRIGVADPADAARVVNTLASRGVDLIKVRESVDAETFVAIGKAARANGLALMGHTMGVPLDRLLEAEIGSIEHFFIPFLDDMPGPDRQKFFAELAVRNVAFVPNLFLFKESELTPNEEILAFLDDEEGKLDLRRLLLSKYLLKDWREQLEQDRTDDRKAFFRRLLPAVVRDAREMRAAGVRILPGTDTAVVFVFPGWALQEELALYVELLGFSPLEAIEAATRQTAEFMGVADEVGTIESGMRADMLLLSANPLDDIRNTARIEAVIALGRVLDRDQLEALVEGVADEPDVSVDDWGRYPDPSVD
jgi:imidazolonepropionase-like amidohydrolase